MKRTVPLVLTLTVALAAATRAADEKSGGEAQNRQAQGAATARGPFRQDQPVVVVGEITSSPKRIAGVQEEQKMQVGIGPTRTDYTLHLSGAQLFGASGQKIEENDLVDKMWIRAEGTVMDDPRRIKVTKLQVIGKDLPGLKRSAFYRPGFDQGYVMAVAGTRQIYPETIGAIFAPAAMVIIGKVSDDTGALETTRKIQVDAAGNTWTLSVPKEVPVFNTKGEKISVHEIAKGQWVRAHGWQTDDLRMRVARMENVGADEAFRSSAYSRTGEPLGYVEREPGTGIRFSPLRMTGVVTATDVQAGTITLRDERGMERVIYVETVTITADGKPVDLKALQKGQRVMVEGSEIAF